MSTKLKIWTAWNKEPRERMFWEDPPVIVRPPLVQVRVYLELLDEHGRKGVTLIWQMEAYEDHDEPCMRHNMLASTRWERQYHINGNPDPRNITAIEVDDPTGLLKWLCPGQDLKDFFNAQNQNLLNDKSLRLPAPH